MAEKMSIIKEKNKKGISLIALVVTVIVLLIILSIAVNIGSDNVDTAELNKFTTELQIMEAQVNNWNQQGEAFYKNLIDKGTNASDSTVAQECLSELGITDLTDYYYFSADTIKNEFNIEGITQDFIINIKTRDVISVNGFEYEGKTYYSLSQLETDGIEISSYTVEYEEDGLKGEISFEASANSTQKRVIDIKDITLVNNVNKYNIYYKKADATSWKLAEERTSSTDDYSLKVDSAGNWQVKLEDAAGNYKIADVTVKSVANISFETSKDDWTNENVVVTVNTDDISSSAKTTITVKKENADGTTTTAKKGTDYTINGNVITVINNNITISVSVVENGVTEQEDITINYIDKTLPTVAISPNGYSKNILEGGKTSITTTLAVDDAKDSCGKSSGLKTVKYAWATSNTVEPDLKEWKEVTLTDGQTSVTENITKTNCMAGTYYLWTKVIDGAGNGPKGSVTENENYALTVSEPFVINGIGVAFNITPDSVWTNQDIVVSVDESNFPAGTKVTLSVTKSDGSTAVEGTDYVIDNVNKTVTVKNNNIKIIAIATDPDNNQASNNITITNIDRNKPTVEFKENGGTLAMSNSNTSIIKTTVSFKDDLSGVDINNQKPQYAWSTSDSSSDGLVWQDFESSKFSLDGSILQTTVTSAGKYYLWVKAIDEAGNEVIAHSNAFEVVNTEIKLSLANGGNYTTDNVTVNIDFGTVLTESRKVGTGYTVSTAESNVTEVTSQTTTSVIETNEYYVYVEAKDVNGNKVTNYIQITNIDRVGPTAPTVTNSLNGVWTNKNVTVTLTSTDTQSGVDHYEWYENGAWTTRALTTTTNSDGSVVGKITYTAERDAELQFRAVDKLGNVSEVSTTKVKIDTTAPKISDITNSTNQEWTNDSVKLTWSITEKASGISKVEYSYDGTNFVGSLSEAEWYGLTRNNERNDTLYIRATDIAGNVSNIVSSSLKIDKTNPVISSVTQSLESGNYTNSNVTITGVAKDALSGIKYYQFSTNASVTASSSGWTAITATTDEITETYSVSENGTYYFNVKDQAGNVSKKEIQVVGIDTEKPKITVNPTSATVTKNKDITISVSDTGASGLSSENSYQYYLSTSATALTGGSWVTYTSGADFNLGSNLTGTYYLFVKNVKDNAGNVSTSNGTAITIDSVQYQKYGSYIFDNSAPTITITPTSSTLIVSSSTGKATITATVKATDVGTSGLNTLEYVWSTSSTVPSTGWGNFTNGGTITTTSASVGMNYLHIKVTDKLGNQSTKTASYNVVDNPIGISFDKNGWVNTDKVATISIANSVEGTLKIECTGTSGTDYVIDETNKTVTIKTNGQTITATYTDTQGNVAVKTSTVTDIDKEKPSTPTITNTSNGKWTNAESVTITVKSDDSATSTFGKSGVKNYQYKKQGDSSWTTLAMASDGSASVTLTASGEYTYVFRAVDNAGNISAESSTQVKIDRTLPTASISTTANASYEIKPGNTTVAVGTTITATDAGGSALSVSQYQFSTSTTVPADDDGNWKNFTSGTAVSDNLSGGTYYLYLKVIDSAGNRAEFKKSTVTFTVKYQVVYSTEDGWSGVPSKQLKVQDSALTLSTTTLTKTGYTFVGWSETKGATEATYTAGGSYTANKAVTLYPAGTVNSYTITYDYNDSKNYAEVLDSEKTFTGFSGKTNHCFNLYKFKLDDIAENDQVTISFDMEYTDLTIDETNTARLISQGSGSSTGWNPGICWQQFILNLSGTGTYHYESTLTITSAQATNEYFSLNLRTDYYTGGTIKITNLKVTRTTKKTETKTYGSTLGTLPSVASAGYTFDGWYTSPTGGTKVTSSTAVGASNVTYYAHWTTNSYTLTVNPESSKTTQNYGTTLSVTAPTQNYTVTYNANGGSVSTTKATSNRTFSSWTLSGSGAISSTTASTTTYLYGAGDGTLTASYNLTGNAVTLPTPSRTGYTFNGWYTASSGGTKAGTAGASYSPTSNITLYAQWVDDTAPTISSVTGNPTSWTASDVTLTVSATDSGSGLATECYSFDGGETWQASNTKTYSANTSGIVIMVKDVDGNIATYDTINITKIDKTAPEVSFNPDGGTYVLATSGSTLISTAVTVVDKPDNSNSGLKTLQYAWSAKDTTAEPSSYSTFLSGATIQNSVSEAGTYYLWIKATDNVGNTTKISKSFVVVEDGLSLTADINIWTNKNVTVTADFGTNVIYSTTTVTCTGTKDTDYTINGNVVTVITNGQTVTAVAKDALGNTVSKTYEVTNIDKDGPTKPTISLKETSTSGSSYTSGSWTNKTIYNTVTSTDSASGIAKYQYSKDNSTWNDIPSDWTPTYNTNKTTLNYYISWNVNSNFYIRAVDSLGNVGTASDVFTLRIDKTVPTITVSPTSSTVAQTASVTITASDNLSGLSSSNSYQYYLSTSNTSLAGGSWVNYTSGTAFNIGTGITGTRYLWVKQVADNAGNVSAVTNSSYGNYTICGSYVFDNTAPICTITANPSANPTNASSITYTFTWSEAVTGFTTDDITVANGTKGTFTASSSTVYTLVVTNSGTCTQTVSVADNVCTDAVGNNNTSASISRTIDRTAPTCTITANPSANPTNASSITYTFTWSEAVTGFTTDDITVTNGTKGTFTASSSTVYTLVVTNSGTCTQTITVPASKCTDAVGNNNTSASISRTIDRTAPTVTITANTADVTNASSVTYTFTWSEAVTGFDADSITVTNGTKGTFTASSSTVYTLVVTNSGTTTQTVKVSANACADAVGNNNTAEVQKVVTIDKTGPSITISPNSNSTLSKATKITITAKDSGGSTLSSSNSYQYYLSTSNSSLAGGNWATYTNGTEFSIGTGITGTRYVWVKQVSDSLGNVSSVTNSSYGAYTISGAFVFDNTAPTITISPTSSSGSKTATVTITVKDNDGGCGLSSSNSYEYYLSTSNSTVTGGSWKTYSSDTEFTIGTGITGTRYIWVKQVQDTLGNTSAVTTSTYYLVSTSGYTFDNTAPTITVSPSSATTAVKSTSVKITVADNTGGSGLSTSNSYQYYLSTSNTSLAGGSWATYTSGTSFTIGSSATGTRYLWIKQISDKAGNTSAVTNSSYGNYTICGSYVFDNSAPTISVTGGKYLLSSSGTATLSTTITVSENGSATAGTRKYIWSQLTSQPSDSDTGWVTFTSSSQSVSKDVTTQGTWYLYVVASDNLLNSANNVATFEVVDNPISLSYTPNSGWTNQNVTVIASVLEDYADSLTLTCTGTSGTDYSINTTNKTVTLMTNGQTVTATVKDNAGTTRSQTLKIATIDKQAPTMNSIEISPTGWTNGTVTITAKATDVADSAGKYGVSGIKYYQFSTSGSLTASSSGWTAITATTSQVTQTYSVNANGTYYFYVKDQAGNINKNSIAVSKIDTAKPTATIGTNSGSYEITPGNTTATVSSKVTATKNGSDLSVLQYQFSTSTSVPADTDSNWKTFTSGTAFSDNLSGGTYYLYIKVIDEAGNRAELQKATGTFVVKYQVVYSNNDGWSGAPSTQLKVQNTALTLSSTKPTKTGYTFVGWSETKGATTETYSSGGSYTANKAVTLYPAGTINSYTITYDHNDGTSTKETVSKEYGSTLGTLPTPTRTGYKFSGWYTASSDGEQISSSTTVGASDVTYYAHWEIQSYTLTVNPGGSTTTKNYGSTLSVSAPAQSYTVTYNVNGGDALTTTKVTSSKVFNSWTLSGAGSISSKTTNPTTYTYGAGAGTLTANYNSAGTSVTLPTPTKTGYTFNGWYTATTGGTKAGDGGASYSPTDNITLYAQWLDKTAPTISSVSGNPTSWISGNVTLTVSASDDGSGLATSAYSFDGGETWQTSNQNTYSANTSGIVIKVRDADGNIATYSTTISITKIDKTAPVVSYNPDGGTYVLATSGNTTISSAVTVTDKPDGSNSGLKTLQYGWSTSSTTAPTYSTFTNGATLSNTVTSAGTYYLWVKATDNVSNSVETKKAFTVVENGITLTAGATTWTNSNVTVTASWGSNITYSSKTLKCTGTSGTDYTISGDVVTVITNGQTVTATAQDALGNTVSKTYTVSIIDKENPSAPTVTNSSNGNWTNGAVKVTLTSTDSLSGIDHYEWIENGSWTTRAMTTTNGVGTITYTAARNLEISFRAVDKVGNVSETVTSYVRIETTVPTITISPSSSTVAKTAKVTITAQDTGGSSLSSSNSYQYYLSTSNTSLAGGSWTNYTSGTAFEIGSNITGTRYLWVKQIADNAGNVSAVTNSSYGNYTISGSYVFDNNAPSVSIGTNGGTYTITPGNTTASVSTTISASENGTSGISTLKYQFSTATSAPADSDSNWATFTSGNTITKTLTGGTWYLYVKATDGAGNVNSTKSSAYTVNYQVVYNANGGSNAPSAQTKTHGTALTLTTSVPDKTGYTFNGWATSSSATTEEYSAGESYTTDQAITLYAVWKVNTYTIVYNANATSGGSTASSTHTYGVAKALTTNGYTRTGYTFSSWNTSANGSGTKYTDGQSVTNLTSTDGATINLYAQWIAKSHTVTVDPNGGTYSGATTTKTYTQNYGTTVTISDPTRTGYTFGGWVVTKEENGAKWIEVLYQNPKEEGFTNEDGAKSKNTLNAYSQLGQLGNMTYNDQYEFMITADEASGYNRWIQTSNPVETTTVTGYQAVQNSWNTSSFAGLVKCSANTLLAWNTSASSWWYAIGKYSVGTCPIIQSLNLWTTMPVHFYVRAASDLSNITTSVTGTLDSSNNMYFRDEDVTLTAVWLKDSYTVTYDHNDGTSTKETAKVVYGSTLGTLPTPERTGYAFNGWFTSATGGTQVTSSTVMGASNVTYYAQWSIKSYTLTVNPGGSTSTQNYASTKSVTAPTQTYTVTYNANGGSVGTGSVTTNRTFSSWALTGAGSISSTTANPTTYTYGAGDGTLTASYGNGAAVTLPTPSRTGYTFSGWYTATTGGTKAGDAGASYTPTGSITLYAQWTINNYTITYDNNYLANDIWTNTSDISNYTYYSTSPSSRTTTTDTSVKNATVLEFTMNEGSTGGVYYKVSTKLTAGTQYTWSVFVKASSAKTLNMGDEQNGTKSVNVTTSWQKFTYTFTATDRSIYAFIFYLNGSSWTAGDKLYVHSLEIEQGDGSSNKSSASKQYNSTLGTLPTPTRTGYTFNGWWTEPTGGTQISSSTVVGASDVTYYAHWTTQSYTLTVNPGGSTSTQNYGTTKSVTASTQTYTVTYNANGGSCGTSSVNSTRAFSSWTLSGSGAISSTTANPTTYTYGAGDGTLTANYGNGAAVTLPTPTRTGYTFNGWYTASSGGTLAGAAGASYTPTGSITLYAQWSDTTAPTAPTVTNSSNGAWSNVNVTITASSTDMGSGINKFQYSYDNSTWSDWTGGTLTDITNGKKREDVWSAERNNTLYIRAVDNAGNTSASTSTTVKIDKTAPTVSYNPDGGTYVLPTSGGATLKSTVTVTDKPDGSNSGLSTLQYAWSAKDTTTEPSSYATFTSGSALSKTATETGTYYLWVKATDTAGNTTKTNKAFTVVNDGVTLTPSATTWTNQNVTVTANFGTNSYTSTSVTCTGTSGTDYTISGNVVTVITNGQTVTATAKDSLGNTVSKTCTVSIIDKTAPTKPTVSLKLNSSSGSAYTSGNWTNQNVFHTITTTETGSGIAKYQYSHNNSSWTDLPSTWTTTYSDDNTTVTYIINWAGNWNFYVRAIDNAGNVSSSCDMYTVKIDKTVPTITVSPTSSTVAQTASVTITASDASSGLSSSNSYQYYLSTSNTSLAGGSWTNYTSGTAFTIGSNATGTRYLWVKQIADNAGNVSAVTNSSYGNYTICGSYVFDNSAPSVSIGTNGGTYTITPGNTTASVSTTISASENGTSGISTLKYQFSTATSAPADSDSNWATFTSGSTITKTLTGGTWYLYVKATDSAGNVNSTKSSAYTVNYQVVYNANGGNNAPSAQTKTHGTALTLSTSKPDKPGYTFNGWSTSSSATSGEYSAGGSYTENKAITLYAVWSANTYTVVYNGNGSTGGSTASSSHTYDTAKNLTSNGFERTGYTFNSWNTSADGSGTKYTDGQSVINLTSTNGGTVTLYAQWTGHPYTVVYNGNGATRGSTASSSHTYGVAKALTTNGYERTGYKFSGWNTLANGSGTNYTDGQSVTNLTSTSGGTVTLYAQWTAITYSIAYNGNGSTSGSMSNSSHTYDVAKTLTTNAYSKPGYDFSGWNTVAGGTGTTYTNGQSVKNLTETDGTTITLYAQWSIKSYTLTVNPGESKYTQNYGSTLSVTAPTQSYTVTYNANGGSCSTGSATSSRTFTSWTLSGSGSISSTTANPTTYTYGAGNDTLTANYNSTGSAVTLPTPTRTGYNFNGWYTASSGGTKVGAGGASYSPTSSITLYAQWSDTTAPTITLGSNSNTTWSKTASVTVKIQDQGSGLASGASIQYGWSTSASTEPSSYTTASLSYTAGTTSAVTFTASASGLTGKYYLWVVPTTLKDVSGNSNTTTVKSTGTFYLDNSAPTITLGSNSNTTWSKTASVTVTVRDASSGLASGASIQYGWSTSTSTEPSSYANASLSTYTAGTTSAVTFTASASGLTGKYYLWVVPTTLKDTLGNSNTTTVKSTGTFYLDNSKPTVTGPSSTSVNSGSTATFSVTASSNYSMTYQWYYRTSSSGTWTKVSTGTGGTSSSYTTAATTSSMNGYQYKCDVTNTVGTTASSTATLTVYYTHSISTQPSSVTVVAGNSTSFTVAATGGNPSTYTYQWYYKTSSSGSETQVTSNGTSATYTISSPTTSMSGYIFYCKVSNSKYTVTSSTATLTVQEARWQNTTSSKYYNTLESAVTGSSTGTEIKLLRSYTDSSSGTISKNLTINTNGYTLTRSAAITANSGYTLTVKGSGTITNSTTGVLKANGGTVEVTAGNITAVSGGNAIWTDSTNNGTITISGGTVQSQSDYGAIANNGTGTVTVSGGTVKNGYSGNGINNNSSGKLNVTGGTVSVPVETSGSDAATGCYAVYNKAGGTITLSGGNITSQAGNYVVGAGASATGDITVSGATLKGTYGIITIKGSTSDIILKSGEVNISGYWSVEGKGSGTIYVQGATISNSSTGGINVTNGADIRMSSGTINASNAEAINSNGDIYINGGTVYGKANAAIIMTAAKYLRVGSTLAGSSSAASPYIYTDASKVPAIKTDYAANIFLRSGKIVSYYYVVNLNNTEGTIIVGTSSSDDTPAYNAGYPYIWSTSTTALYAPSGQTMKVKFYMYNGVIYSNESTNYGWVPSWYVTSVTYRSGYTQTTSQVTVNSTSIYRTVLKKSS